MWEWGLDFWFYWNGKEGDQGILKSFKLNHFWKDPKEFFNAIMKVFKACNSHQSSWNDPIPLIKSQITVEKPCINFREVKTMQILKMKHNAIH